MTIKYIADLMRSFFHFNYFFETQWKKGKLQMKEKAYQLIQQVMKIWKKKEIELSDSTMHNRFLKCSLESHHLHCFFID